jgi:5-methyltetrahydropteroyltriglutamate--homocysteine methyltransferase
MTSTSPPFRADAVGSYLRTDAIHEARDRFEAGTLDAAGLTAIEDREILELIGKQEAVGLKAVTDGEFRRAWWHFDYFGMLDGVDIVEADAGMAFKGAAAKPLGVQVVGKVGFPADHPMLQHFAFLRDNTSVLPKQCIPSPTVMHFRLAPDALKTSAYAGRDDLFDDLAAAYRDAVKAFYDAGCRYLQFDDTAWAYLCSPEEVEHARGRGLDVENIADAYTRLINESIAEKPDDMVITTHVCRGNFRSTWIASGGYEPVAEVMLGQVNYDGYFLEYDSERAGGFEPLRFLPKGNKIVVVGLITSKSGELEKKDDIKRRLDEAAKFVAYEQMALSPQCGFASTEEGNILTEDEQWAKLRMEVEIANEVWGK